MPPKKKSSTKPEADSLSFETALDQVEDIVNSLESEELPLEELVANYETGSKLLNHCETILRAAKERVELITLDNKKTIDSPGTETTNDHNDRLL